MKKTILSEGITKNLLTFLPIISLISMLLINLMTFENTMSGPNQIALLIPLCVGKYEDGTDCDTNELLSEEIVPLLAFIRGEEDEGAVPLVK